MRRVWSAGEDTQSQNNHLSAYARVLGAPNVLLVEESGTAEKLFSASGMQVERIRPIAMPSGTEGYLAYDAVILNNIEYENASQQQWQALDQAVRALGRGLLVLGGDASYALGGYRGTVSRSASAGQHRRAQQAAHAGPVAGDLHRQIGQHDQRTVRGLAH